MDHYEKLEETGYVGNDLVQRKNDYKDGGIFYRIFLAQKLNICYTRDRYGTLGEKLTFQGFLDTKSLLNTDKYFKLKKGNRVNGEFPLPWKRFFTYGTTFDRKRTTVKEFKSNLKEIKRSPPDELGNMFPYYVE